VFLGVFLLTLATGVTHSALAAEPATKSTPASFECRWTDDPITIDGKVDEAAWKHAQVIDHFYLPWLGEKARPAKTATRAKLLWDRENFYFFADMDDADLYADVTEPDGFTWFNDVFEIFLKPAVDKPPYYEFQVNAAGTKLDMLIPQRGAGGWQRFKKDGEFHIEAKVELRGTLNKWQDKDKGWSVEGKIPWRDFLRAGGRPNPGDTWRFTLCRYDYSVDFEGPELSVCAPLVTPPADFHRHEEYAPLKFVGPDKTTSRPRGISQRIPLTTSKVVGSPEPPYPYRVRKAFAKLDVSLPIAVVNEPGSNRMLFIDQGNSYGKTNLRRFVDDPEANSFETLWSPDAVAYSLCFHPKFEQNGFVYIGHNGPASGDGAAKKCRVSRFTIGRQPPFKFDVDSELVIIDWPSNGHNGAAVTFGLDGLLYVTSGDGTSDSDTNVMGQGLDHLLSKVLRIDVDHPDPGRAYSVPKDNPFVGMKDARPETWAYGLRNPWRITTDAKTGHIWVGNNGQDLWEQIFFVRRGDNYGWSVMEGGHPFYLERKPGPTPFVKPAADHPHSEARSMTGGVVYYGHKLPELRGAYIYGDYSTGKIWGMRHDGQQVTWHQELTDTTLQISGFGTDSHGELLIADHHGGKEGGFYFLEPNPQRDESSKFPTRLSESGLFSSVKGHVVDPALIPYSVNAPLWSDGAHKERWIALPEQVGDDGQPKPPHIGYARTRGWTFPDGTVLVKSFALDLEEGNPASRRWIETRFLTRQDGEWVGYSYVWNDDQTDATLVARQGTDRDFEIKTKSGSRKQTWHYPSRAECMVCHSRAANYVLGLTEVQFNTEHDFSSPSLPKGGQGGSQVIRDNQLKVLEHLGLIGPFNWTDEVKTTLREELQAKGLSDKEVTEEIEKQTAARPAPASVMSALLPFNPETHRRRLVDPYDATQNLEARARSYLHANCSQCHVEAGGGNALFEMEFTTRLEKSRLLDVKPVHHTFGLPDAKLIAPGHPERSVLLHRISHRQQGHMPPLASSRVDDPAVNLIRDWIASLKP